MTSNVKDMNSMEVLDHLENACGEYQEAKAQIEGNQIRFYVKSLLTRLMEKDEKGYMYTTEPQDLMYHQASGEPFILNFSTDKLVELSKVLISGLLEMNKK